MKQVSSDNFGILIAYVLPGFVTLIGVSFFSETARAWLGSAPTNSPTVSGFLYVTLASIGAGLVVSTIRWLVIDTIHHRTGIPNRKWDYSVLNERFHAYQFLVSNQYRYYQFYGNLLLACASSYGAFLLSKGSWSLWTFAPFLILEFVLWMGSRDTLRNYYARLEMLLGPSAKQSRIVTDLRFGSSRPNFPTDLLKKRGRFR